KDAVIESAFVGSTYAFWMLVIAALMTSFYSWRLMFMTFFGTPRGDHHAHDHAHESPRVMTAPLVVLAFGSIFAGMIWYTSLCGEEGDQRSSGAPVVEASHEAAEPDAAGTATAEAAPAEAGHAAAGPGEGIRTEGVVVGQGAIYMHPDNHVMHDAHYVP